MCNTLHIKFNTGCYSYIASISTKSFSLQLATLAYAWTTYIGSINCIKILIVLSPIFPCLVICKGSATACFLLHGSYNSVWLHKHIRGFQKGASNSTYRIHFKWHGVCIGTQMLMKCTCMHMALTICGYTMKFHTFLPNIHPMYMCGYI